MIAERRVLVPTLDQTHLAPRRAAAPAAALLALGGETMGTTWSVKLMLPGTVSLPAVRAAIDEALVRVIAQMSQWEAGSDLSRYNRAPAGTWHVLPKDFRHVLDAALAMARDTGGAYDPTIGALVDLWGFGPVQRRQAPPDAGDVGRVLDDIRAAGGWQRVAIDGDRVQQPGAIRLDFSSIAKGHTVDLVSQALTALGAPDHLVEIGGELRGEGMKSDRQPWWVALEEPLGARRDTVVALHGLAVATSGDARRFFDLGGRRYGHTLDPRTGHPVDDRVAAVTVLAPGCMTADALATALTVLGPEAGMAHAIRRDIAARFLLRTGAAKRPEELVSPAFAQMMES
jgi:thiamine biosynthesis lipoprotein